MVVTTLYASSRATNAPNTPPTIVTVSEEAPAGIRVAESDRIIFMVRYCISVVMGTAAIIIRQNYMLVLPINHAMQM